MEQEAPELIYVCGPFSGNNRTVFLCPECDDDQVTGLEGAPKTCSTLWLEGLLLLGDDRVGDRSCKCWQTDPYDGEVGATNAQRRFFHYRTIALFFGDAGQRVDLPECVKEKIQELFGDSVVGFHP